MGFGDFNISNNYKSASLLVPSQSSNLLTGDHKKIGFVPMFRGMDSSNEKYSSHNDNSPNPFDGNKRFQSPGENIGNVF